MSKKNDDKEKTPEPFYHESENFSSAYFGKIPEAILRDSGSKPDHKLISSLIAQLTDPNQKENRVKVLSMLRDAQAQKLFVSVIGMNEYKKYRAELITAAWESGLDFSAHLGFFIENALDPDFNICMESCTVITENMDGPMDALTVKDAIEELKKAPGTHKELIAGVIAKLEELNH